MSGMVVKSAERVLRVFELFSGERTPLTAAEISRRLVWPKSSANMLLRSLVSLGYLSLDLSTLEYFPSPRLAVLGNWIPHALLAGDEALRFLEDLRDKTGETATLSVQNGFSMQFVTVLPGTFPISLTMREGLTTSIFKSAVGLAYLSAQTDEAVRRLAQRANHRNRDAPRLDVLRLLKEVRIARERGYSIAYESTFADTGAIAYALTQSGRPTIVAGVGGLAQRIRRSEGQLVEALRNAFRGMRASRLGAARESSNRLLGEGENAHRLHDATHAL